MFIQIDNDVININHIIMIECYRRLRSAADPEGSSYYNYVMKIHLRGGLTKVVVDGSSYDKFKKLQNTMGRILACTDHDVIRNIKLDCDDIKFDNSLPIIKSGVKYL